MGVPGTRTPLRHMGERLERSQRPYRGVACDSPRRICSRIRRWSSVRILLNLLRKRPPIPACLQTAAPRTWRGEALQRAQQMQKREKSFGIQMLSVQPDTKPKGCAGCNRKIKDRYLLKALDKYWHEDCLKCACCDCRLGEVGSTLYTKANLILCRRDYLRLFGVTGNCAACSKLIPAFEMVMRAKENVYHLDCFACQLCNQRFCVGDKFFLKNNMILCQTDYEEGLMKEGYAPQVR
ncbi:LIM domain only protein 3 isoform X1 [Pungitius pungitius]|uniref:LIM domain only protein 3 isoform X1 n=1 Tax=Pungitius pungitius TaxID=134920 RepID=UPI001888B2D7|nr:LIM domain only protein 3 isoform X1 [Pungitius pungitius]